MENAVECFNLEKLCKQIDNIERYEVNNVKLQVKQITSELMMMKSYLKDADKRQSEEEIDRQWVRVIKALAYRTEDAIETFDIRIESRNGMSTSGMSFKRILKKITNFFDIKYLAARDVQIEIDEIKVELDEFREAQRSAGLTGYSFSQNVLDYMCQIVENVVQAFATQGSVCIYSTDDIGGSFLARKVLNHNKIQRHFTVAWVDIPQQFSSRIVFERILCQFEKRRATRDLEESELAERLLTFQKKRRCLIVLNNIRSTDAWEMLKVAFPLGNRRSTKLLIVTSSHELEQITTAENRYINQMWSLTGNEAWRLLDEYVTERDGAELNAGEARNRDEEPVTLSTEYTLQQGNVENEITEVTEGMKMVQQAPTLTYNDLQYQLRACVCYLAAFPEGTEMKAEKLYHLWMAEGLLSSDNYHSENLLRIAETYLNILHQGGMVDVQGEESTTARRFKSCSLRNSIRPEWLMVGRREEFFMVLENGLEHESDPSASTDRTVPQESDPSSSTRRTIRLQEPGPSSSNDRTLPQESNPSSSSDTILRLVINGGKHGNIKSLGQLNDKLRCLVVRELDTQETLYLLDCIQQWTCLRILDFDGINFGNMTLPKRITKLVHLRYLSFLGCRLKTLPKSICNLPYLQILDLRVSNRIKIPNVLHKMKRLRHLYLPSAFITSGGVKLKLTGLTQLETLENFNTRVCDVKDLFTFPKLIYLSITVEGSLEDLHRLAEYMNMTSDELRSSVNIRKFDCYAEERHLVFRQLLHCHPLDVLDMEGHLGMIPPYGEISEKLSKIVLSGSELHDDPMPTLGKLHKLQVLILNDDAFVGKEIICSASNFPELRHLELSNCHVVKSWRIEEGAMSKLSALKIENCSQLKMLPDGLQFLTNLQELKILRMSKPFKNRLRYGGSCSEIQFDPMPTLEKLPKLQMLILNNDAFVGKEIICSASNFPKLRHLQLSDLSDLESWRIEEGAMSKLSTLIVENCIQLMMLPDGLQFLTNLRELKIQRMPDIFNNWLREMDGESGLELEIDPMVTLEKLPNLWMLILNDVACARKEIVCSANNFPKLEHLELSNLSVLESWRIEEKAMPMLSYLKIESCSQLKMLPDGLRFLANLKKLKILGMPEPFNNRLREVDGERGADMDKLPNDALIKFNDGNESSE